MFRRRSTLIGAALLAVAAVFVGTAPALAGPAVIWAHDAAAPTSCGVQPVGSGVDTSTGSEFGVYAVDTCSTHATKVVAYGWQGGQRWLVQDNTHDDVPSAVVVSRKWHLVIVASTRNGNELLVQAYSGKYGSIVWAKGLVATGGATFHTTGLALDGDDRVIVTGAVTRNGTTTLSAAAFDVPNGPLLWHVHYPGQAGLGATPTAIAADPQLERAYLVGTARTRSGHALMTLCFDTATGNVLWEDEVARTTAVPVGIAVDTTTHDVVMVSGDSVDTGTFLYDFSPDGILRWSQTSLDDSTDPRELTVDPGVGAVYVLAQSYSPDRTTVIAYSITGTKLWAISDAAHLSFPQGIAVDTTGHRVYATSWALGSDSTHRTITFALNPHGVRVWRDTYTVPDHHPLPSSVAIDAVKAQVYVSGLDAGQFADAPMTIAYHL